jgi:hypothetical protein
MKKRTGALTRAYLRRIRCLRPNVLDLDGRVISAKTFNPTSENHLDLEAAIRSGRMRHRVRYPLAHIVTVPVRWDPLADIRQRGGHIGHHVLIELDQHRFGPTRLGFKAFDLAMRSDGLCSIVNRTALAFQIVMSGQCAPALKWTTQILNGLRFLRAPPARRHCLERIPARVSLARLHWRLSPSRMPLAIAQAARELLQV